MSSSWQPQNVSLQSCTFNGPSVADAQPTRSTAIRSVYGRVKILGNSENVERLQWVISGMPTSYHADFCFRTYTSRSAFE